MAKPFALHREGGSKNKAMLTICFLKCKGCRICPTFMFWHVFSVVGDVGRWERMSVPLSLWCQDDATALAQIDRKGRTHCHRWHYVLTLICWCQYQTLCSEWGNVHYLIFDITVLLPCKHIVLPCLLYLYLYTIVSWCLLAGNVLGVIGFSKMDVFFGKLPNGLWPPPPHFWKLHCAFFCESS